MSCDRNDKGVLIKQLFVVIVVLLLIMPLSVFSVEKDEGFALSEKFRTSENSIDKRRILQSLSEIGAVQPTAVPQWKVDLVRNALSDKSPVVVEAAAKQAGNLVLKELTPQLISLFESAGDRFYGGYAERVRVSLFHALGKTGGNKATDLFKDFLKKDNGSFLAESALLAVKELNNPELVPTVKNYILKMETRVSEGKALNADPIRYSRYLKYIQLGKEVENSLLTVKGGEQ